MRTTIAIDDDVLQAAKSLAAQEQKPLGVIISELMRRALRPAAPAASAHGLPVFSVSPSAPPLTLDMVRQALDE